MKPHKGADMNEKSVQESGLLGHYPKGDLRDGSGRFCAGTYTRTGKALLTRDWAMKIAYPGRRETFPVGTRERRLRPGCAMFISRGSELLGGQPWPKI
jgi:hypothetical protein